MSKITLNAELDENCRAVRTEAEVSGEWPTDAIVGAFEGLGKFLARITDDAASQIRKENRHTFVMDCCVTINKGLMELPEKYK